MDKLKEKLKMPMEDKKAAFIILAAVALTMAITIGVFAVIKQNQIIQTSGETSPQLSDSEQVEDINDLAKVESINSIEDLQKLNEKELEEAKKKEESSNKNVATTPSYYIKVNYGAQVVTIYKKDSKGKYTVPVKAMVCSTGTYTPSGGVYKTPNRFRWLHMIGDVYGQYCTQIVGDILFHSVPYLTKGDHSSLEYWAYDQLGTRASLGCVRLTCADAKWIYNNCKLGTQVEFYSSSNPGPLGKPSARKISNAPSYVRGWDPTDPVSNNPWKKYLANGGSSKDENKNNSVKNETTNSNTTGGKDKVNNVVTNNLVVNDTVVDPVNDIVANEVVPDKKPEVETNTLVNETTTDI